MEEFFTKGKVNFDLFVSQPGNCKDLVQGQIKETHGRSKVFPNNNGSSGAIVIVIDKDHGRNVLCLHCLYLKGEVSSTSNSYVVLQRFGKVRGEYFDGLQYFPGFEKYKNGLKRTYHANQIMKNKSDKLYGKFYKTVLKTEDSYFIYSGELLMGFENRTYVTFIRAMWDEILFKKIKSHLLIPYSEQLFKKQGFVRDFDKFEAVLKRTHHRFIGGRKEEKKLHCSLRSYLAKIGKLKNVVDKYENIFNNYNIPSLEEAPKLGPVMRREPLQLKKTEYGREFDLVRFKRDFITAAVENEPTFSPSGINSHFEVPHKELWDCEKKKKLRHFNYGSRSGLATTFEGIRIYTDVENITPDDNNEPAEIRPMPDIWQIENILPPNITQLHFKDKVTKENFVEMYYRWLKKKMWKCNRMFGQRVMKARFPRYYLNETQIRYYVLNDVDYPKRFKIIGYLRAALNTKPRENLIRVGEPCVGFRGSHYFNYTECTRSVNKGNNIMKSPAYHRKILSAIRIQRKYRNYRAKKLEQKNSQQYERVGGNHRFSNVLREFALRKIPFPLDRVWEKTPLEVKNDIHRKFGLVGTVRENLISNYFASPYERAPCNEREFYMDIGLGRTKIRALKLHKLDVEEAFKIIDSLVTK